jgi:dienelactone hydrolase
LANATYQGHDIYIQYPTKSASDAFPVVVFMHGMTLGWEWYARHISQWSSHGFVIVFPFVKDALKDDGIIPVTETDATSIYVAVEYLKALTHGTVHKPADFQGTVDIGNIGIVGHSMGGENTIRAAAGVRVPAGMPSLPAGAMKVAIAQHPSLCTFPPPYPYTINKVEINNASLKAPLLLFTAENDRAFLPGTPGKEHTCWKAATGRSLFASFKASVCGGYPSCSSMTGAYGCDAKVAVVGSGHMCACDAPGLDTWTSPELKWVTSALRLYLHHNASSVCGALLWGNGDQSLQRDPNVANVEEVGSPQADVAKGVAFVV